MHDRFSSKDLYVHKGTSQIEDPYKSLLLMEEVVFKILFYSWRK